MIVCCLDKTNVLNQQFQFVFTKDSPPGLFFSRLSTTWSTSLTILVLTSILHPLSKQVYPLTVHSRTELFKNSFLWNCVSEPIREVNNLENFVQLINQ